MKETVLTIVTKCVDLEIELLELMRKKGSQFVGGRLEAKHVLAAQLTDLEIPIELKKNGPALIRCAK